MNKILIILFGIILFQLLPLAESNIYAQHRTEISAVPVPAQKIEAYRNDNAFKYIKQKPVFDVSGTLMDWFVDFLRIIFKSTGAAPYIRYAVIVLVILFAFSKILGGDYASIFMKNKKLTNKNSIEYGEENIHGIDFDNEIDQAIKALDFRLATRFLYLKLLKDLDKKGYIQWQLGKTNSTYQKELEAKGVSEKFNKLSKLYEYSWYGHFKINQAEYEQVEKKFQSMEN